jgi:hydrogenase expression/formation protein HypC
MCLGLPAKVIEVSPEHEHVVIADVLGEKTRVNVGLIEGGVVSGDWVMLHAGFAMTKIDAAEAEQARQGLLMMRGPADDGEDEFAGF